MLRRLIKVAAPILFVVVVATACSSDGFPTSYSDQEDPGTGLTLVESNWLNGCEVGVAENLAEDANNVCGCAYERLSGPGGIPFEDFVEMNNELKDDPEGLISDESIDATERDLINIVKACIAG